jgi:hypothetical protein
VCHRRKTLLRKWESPEAQAFADQNDILAENRTRKDETIYVLCAKTPPKNSTLDKTLLLLRNCVLSLANSLADRANQNPVRGVSKVKIIVGEPSMQGRRCR